MSTQKKTVIGGQALIEGIMMRGPDKVATVVRKADGSHIVKQESYIPLKDKYPILGWPLIRGIVGLGSSLKTGISQLMFSAEQAEFPEEPPSKFDLWVDKKFGMEKAEKFLMALSVVFGVAIPVLLFILLPTLLAGVLDLFPAISNLTFVRSLLESVLRIAIFILFLFTTSRLKEMRRVYSYHGAEHKAVFCYEAGEDLTVENVRKFSRRHPRCGTSFLFVVMIISIFVFSFVPSGNVWLRFALRIVLLPVVVGLSYEINRLVGRYDNALTKILRAPGLALQGLTTNEPDDSMIEVAIDALSRVIPEREGADEW